jgi:hypothetical protein
MVFPEILIRGDKNTLIFFPRLIKIEFDFIGTSMGIPG